MPIDTINSWHYHIQLALPNTQIPITDLVCPSAFIAADTFVKVSKGMDAEGWDTIDTIDYINSAVEKFEALQESGDTIGIFCTLGKYIIRIYNCRRCLGSSMN